MLAQRIAGSQALGPSDFFDELGHLGAESAGENYKNKNKKQKKQSEKGHPSYDIIFTSSVCRLRSITVVSWRGTCVLWHRGYRNGYC
jgi:hypothetical protein